jgi:hypothetical protein
MSELVEKGKDIDHCLVIGYGLSQSFVSEQITDEDNINAMALNCVDIEDDPLVLELEVDEATEQLEKEDDIIMIENDKNLIGEDQVRDIDDSPPVSFLKVHSSLSKSMLRQTTNQALTSWHSTSLKAKSAATICLDLWPSGQESPSG